MELRDIPIRQTVHNLVFYAGFAIRLEQANAVLDDCSGNGNVEHDDPFQIASMM
jgi:hypothetical protein